MRLHSSFWRWLHDVANPERIQRQFQQFLQLLFLRYRPTFFNRRKRTGAEEIIVAHNHPSDVLTPSKGDVAVTKELKDLAARLGVAFIDHIILGSSALDYVSLAEKGLL